MKVPHQRSSLERVRMLDDADWLMAAGRLQAAMHEAPGTDEHVARWREYVVACMGNLVLATDDLDFHGTRQLTMAFNEGLWLASEGYPTVPPVVFTPRSWRRYIEHVIDPQVELARDIPMPDGYADLYSYLINGNAWFTDLRLVPA
jgi:hypothetical protein